MSAARGSPGSPGSPGRECIRARGRVALCRLLPAFLCLALSGACAEERDRLRVTVVGIDGATWRVIQPMLDRGELPNVAALMKAGVSEQLVSERPLLSPAIWTTISTGVSRKVHDIRQFRKSDDTLVSSRDRKAPALWTWASRSGLRSAVIGWWATYPAETINRVVISERALKTRELDIQKRFANKLVPPDLAHLAHPPEALLNLAATLFEMPERGGNESNREWVRRRVRVEDQAGARALVGLRQSYGPFDLELVLLRGVDPVSHVFWRYLHPEDEVYAELPPLEANELTRYGSTIEDQYRLVDSLLGELDLRPSDDHVIFLLSDHGFEADISNTGPDTTGHHRSTHAIEGIFIAAGGPIAQGARADTPLTIYDLAPTILHLLGLAIPDDLPGHVHTELLNEEWAAAHPVQRDPVQAALPTDLPPDTGRPPEKSATEERLRAELQALGYIE